MSGRAVPIPNAMTSQQTARLVAQRLEAMQSARLELELIQLANDHEDSDGIEGLPKTGPDGKVLHENGDPIWVTYGERYAEMDAAAVRVWKRAATEGVQGLVEKMIAADVAAAEAGTGS